MSTVKVRLIVYENSVNQQQCLKALSAGYSTSFCIKD